MATPDIGLIGLAVMGQNLALNMANHGYVVAVYNRTTAKTDEYIAENPGASLVPARSLQELVALLPKPRKIMLMVKAGAGTDAVIAELQLGTLSAILDRQLTGRQRSMASTW